MMMMTLKAKGANYTATQFFKDEPLGSIVKEFRNEDLEQQTFDDDSFDYRIDYYYNYFCYWLFDDFLY